MGGMFVKAGGLNFDPQIIKPPAGYKGSDQIELNTDKAKAATAGSLSPSSTPGQVVV